MSATDEVRAGLDAMSAEWWPNEGDPKHLTERIADGVRYKYRQVGRGIIVSACTEDAINPAQAIAATLGSDDTFTREDVEGAFVSGYSLGLDMFDSSKPDNEKGWNQNKRNMDEEMEDLGWVRKDAAKLGTGTCKADETETIKCWVKCEDEPSTEHMELIHVMECSTCGGTYEHVNGGYEYCPHCRAKVVDE